MNPKSRAILLGGSLLGAALAGAGEITRVSVDSAGNQGNDASVFSAISAGGRYVAFQSSASNLLPAGTSVRPNIFVHDRQSGVTEVVSVDSTGVVRGGGSDGRVSPLELSADGRHVAFTSHFDDLVDEDTNGSRDVFVHDRRSGMTERVSVDAGGRQIFRGGWAPSISAGGRFVTFHSFFKIFVRDREAGTTERHQRRARPLRPRPLGWHHRAGKRRQPGPPGQFFEHDARDQRRRPLRGFPLLRRQSRSG